MTLLPGGAAEGGHRGKEGGQGRGWRISPTTSSNAL